MKETLLILIFGVGLLLISTKVLIDLSEKLSHALKISPLFVGITIVALGTSLPELSVSTIAAVRGDIGLGLGNIVGSNIINIFMVLPAGILMGKLRIGTTKTQRNAVIVVIATALFIISQLIPYGNFPFGLYLIILSLFLTIAEYTWAVLGRKNEDLEQIKNTRKEKFTLTRLVIMIVAITGVVIGAFITVNSTETISLLTGYSTTFLGFTLTAVATSLPELFATVISQEEHEEKMTIGNILGSNIYNLLLIGGILLLISPGAVINLGELAILAFATLTFFYIIKRYKGVKVPRRVGGALILFLLAYLIFLRKTVN